METNFETFTVGQDEVTKKKLMGDLKAVAHDAEELLKATAGELGEKAKDARARISARLEDLKSSCGQFQDHALAGAKATDKLIREHPYQSVAVAFGVGLVLGLLVNRR